MNFQTERLWVRDPVTEDWEGVHPFLSDPQVMRWTHLGPEPYTLDQSREWIKTQMYHNQMIPRSSHNSVIIERQSQRIIGWIGIGNPEKPSLGDLDLGYALRRDHWGRGYMTEALKGMLTFAFEHLAANVIFGECEAANTGSYRVMEKAGMQHIAVYFESSHRLPNPVQMLRYSISRDVWRVQTGQNLD